MLDQTNQYRQSQHQLVTLTVDPAELCWQLQQLKTASQQQ